MKRYDGTCYIGVAGPDLDYSEARDSIQSIALRPGDGPVYFGRATKGYEARQKHVNDFLASEHDFLLLLDADMVFPVNTLERLRSHGLPYVSGLYMRRSINPIAPVWYRPWDGAWPLEPWVGPIPQDELHPLGASGWGCILVHREVVLAVRALLKGEWEVLEDDMDVWPYDLQAILRAMSGLRSLAASRPPAEIAYAELCKYVGALEQEIRPLRCEREIVGSDIRFPWFAREAGYQLVGDPQVSCGHLINYGLSYHDYALFGEEQLQVGQAEQRAYITQRRQEFAENYAEVTG